MDASLHHHPGPLPLHFPAAEPAAAPAWAWRVLDEIDYGVIVLDADGVLQHANQLAWRELSGSRFLGLEGERVTGRDPKLQQELQRGLQVAASGRRQLLTLRSGDAALPVTCVPLAAGSGPAPVLLILARQGHGASLSLGFFSRSHGLTPAEEGVLRDLCNGLQVKEIARAKGVTVSTVRTQVRSLRDKTGLRHIRLMVQRVAMLPPIVALDPVARAAAQGAWAQ